MGSLHFLHMSHIKEFVKRFSTPEAPMGGIRGMLKKQNEQHAL